MRFVDHQPIPFNLKKQTSKKITIKTTNGEAAFEKTNLALHLSDINLDNGNDSRMNRGGSDLVSLLLFLSLTLPPYCTSVINS